MPAFDPYAALRHRDYGLFLTGHMASIIGAQMQSVAVGWELYERTNSALLLGMVGLAQFLPVILLAIPVGHFIDVYSRKKLLLVSQLLMVAASSGLAIVSVLHGSVFLFYTCLLLVG